MHEEDPIQHLFRKIEAGTATREENDLAARWLAHLDTHPGKLTREEVERQRQELHHTFLSRYGKMQRPIRWVRWISSMAAAVALILAGTWWFTLPRSGPPAEVAYREIITASGQQKRITLPDGSEIMLNHASRIRIPETFGRERREIQLEGEAFFDIARDESKPFTVVADDLQVEVLGTSFNVSSYFDDPTAEVVVASGNVRVMTAADSSDWHLTPGEQLTYNRQTGRSVQGSTAVESHLAWQRGQLLFEEERLQDICRELQRWYGVEINIRTPGIREIRLSLEPRGEPITHVMDVLAVAGNFRYEIQGDSITLY